MLKIIGAIMVITAALVSGAGGILKLKARAKSLSQLISALEMMQGEICDRLTPIPDMVSRLKGETEMPVRALFALCEEKLPELGARSFASIWREAAFEAREMELKHAESSVLAELGCVLGRYDAREQRAAIDYTRKRLESFLRRAEQDVATQGKTRAALGVAAGLMLVIMLI